MTASILYGNRESGHCYKVKLALVLAEVHHEYREVDLDVPFEERGEDFRAASRFGEVPVFVDGNTSWHSRTRFCSTLRNAAANSAASCPASNSPNGCSGRPIASGSRCRTCVPRARMRRVARTPT